MDDCIFCRILRKEIPAHIVWENERFSAFLDANPLNPGHLLIVPKQHVSYVFAMDEALYAEAFRIARQLAGPLQGVTGAKRIGIIVEGFGVDHVHVHLVPINAAHEFDSVRARHATDEELAGVAGQIRSALES